MDNDLIFLSILFLIPFLILNHKKTRIKVFGKVVVFISVLPFLIFQYSILMSGMDWVYHYFNQVPDDSVYLRTGALIFTIACLYSLPIKYSKNNKNQ